MSGQASHLRSYFAVFTALLVLTGVTIWIAFQDFGAFNTPLALGLAGFKATLVVLYFMHVRHSSRLVMLTAASGFVFLVILLVFTFSDYATRDDLPIYGEAVRGF
jgi:cytochrome c oxidase subunit 4